MSRSLSPAQARRRLAALTRAAALGGVSLAVLAPPAQAQGAVGDGAGRQPTAPQPSARITRPLQRPVRAATPEAEAVLGAWSAPQATAQQATAPQFAEPQTNPFNLSGIGTNSTPSVADLDGDGDLDVLSGENNGNYVYLENTAGPGNTPAFATARRNPFNLTRAEYGYSSAPAVADLDGDGDLDVLAGEKYGNFVYFENTAGPGTAPIFAPPRTNPFLLTGVGEESSPSVADLDGDGDLDVLAGEDSGNLVYFENTAGPGNTPAFATARVNPFNLTNVGPGPKPSMADLDGDGDLDVLAGKNDGGFVYFENTAGPGTVPTFTVAPTNLIDIGYTSAPSPADLDGDGDLDVLSGESSNGTFVYFESTANPATDFVTAAVAGDEGFRMLAAPVAGATVGDLLGFTHTQGFPGADSESGTPNVYLYDESATGGLNAGYRAPTSQGEALPLGRGLFAYLFADDDLSADGVQGGFPKTLGVFGAQEYHRFVWGGTGAGALSYTDTTPDPGDDGSAGDDGWNLLGNPFGNWFDWDAVELSGVNAPVYVYDDATSAYRSYSAGFGSLPGGVVGPFQGFWVKANAPAPEIAARAAVSSGGPLYRTAAPLALGLALRPADGGRAERSEAYVVFGTPGAEVGRDGLDALALSPPAAAYVQVASVVPEDVGLSVDHRPALDGALAASGSVEVPVAVAAVGVGGEMVLSWPSFDAAALPAGVRATLRDGETGAEVDLSVQSEYAFTVEAAAGRTAASLASPGAPAVLRTGDGAPRFTLALTSASTDGEGGAPAVALSAAYPNPVRERAVLRLSVPSAQRVRATVYDALGREVAVAFDGDVLGSAEIAVDAGALAPGVYVVRVEGASFAETRRLTVVR